MPTMTSKKLSDLEAERESFRRYERQIIAERDEILKNVHNHLDELEREITRLGGSPCEIKKQTSLPAAPVWSSPEAICGSLKKRGRPQKERVHSFENQDVLLLPSLQSLPNNDGSFVATNSMERKRRVKDEVGKDTSSKERKKPSKHAKVVASDNKAEAEPWTCECGSQMDAGRVRCGKCRRWKGGKRLTRWTLKPRDSAGSDTVSSSKCEPSYIFNAYKNMTFLSELESSSDRTEQNPTNLRLEIEGIMSNMVSVIDCLDPAVLVTSRDVGNALSSSVEVQISNKHKRKCSKMNTNPIEMMMSDRDDSSLKNLSPMQDRRKETITTDENVNQIPTASGDAAKILSESSSEVEQFPRS